MVKIISAVIIVLGLFLAACSPNPGQIRVVTYHDLNNNDIRDPGEPGLEDRVGIGQDISCPIQQKPEELMTGSDGVAIFSDLTPGKYCVMYMGDRLINTKLTVEVYLNSDQEAQVSFGLVERESE
jgi:hypothetical protein